MVMLNPCCCVSPRIGTFIFAVFNLAYAIGDALKASKDIFDRRSDFETLIEIGLCATLIFLAILLLLGAIQNSQEKVRLWLVLWMIFLIVAIVLEILSIFRRNYFRYDIGVRLIFIYQFWVVYAYLIELRYGPAGLTYCPAQVV